MILPACVSTGENREWIVWFPSRASAMPTPSRASCSAHAHAHASLPPHSPLLSRATRSRRQRRMQWRGATPVVHDLCTAVSRIVCDERGLLAALLEMSVRDAAKGPGMLCSVSAQTAAEWAKLSPALHAVYDGLSRILVAKYDGEGGVSPALVDVPAALCFWVIEMHCAYVLHASEHGYHTPKCMMCEVSESTAAVMGCGHRYFCVGCLQKWEAVRGVLQCPTCRATARFVDVLIAHSRQRFLPAKCYKPS